MFTITSSVSFAWDFDPNMISPLSLDKSSKQVSFSFLVYHEIHDSGDDDNLVRASVHINGTNYCDIIVSYHPPTPSQPWIASNFDYVVSTFGQAEDTWGVAFNN